MVVVQVSHYRVAANLYEGKPKHKGIFIIRIDKIFTQQLAAFQFILCPNLCAV